MKFIEVKTKKQTQKKKKQKKKKKKNRLEDKIIKNARILFKLEKGLL